MYPEMIKAPVTDGKKYFLKKRPGTSALFTLGAGQGRGTFYWQTNGNYLSVVGNVLYSNSTAIAFLTTGSGPVGFTEFRTPVSDYIFLCDGTHGYTITVGNVVTLITDANFPSPHIPRPVFLDGYIFLGQAGSQDIINSNLNDATTWPIDGFISAEMFPDNLVGLAKVQNYIAAIGGESIEWFYDNANATGSPLNRNAPAVSQLGCPAMQTINQTEMELILVGQTANGGRTVWVINGFQPTEIATEPVREALDLEGTGIVNATAFTIQCSGHKWYVLNLKTNQRTFVYDFEEQMWHEWGSMSNNVLSGFVFDYAADSGNGSPLLISQNNAGQAWILSPSNYTDGGGNFECLVVTSKIDFDTVMRKRIFRLSLVADGPDNDVPVPITVSWTDDDYNTFTPGTILNLSGGYSTITQLGYTRRRAFQFIYIQPFPLRMESFELDIIQEVRR
jgi:hypothetical protein